jgi:recombination protein RecA
MPPRAKKAATVAQANGTEDITPEDLMAAINKQFGDGAITLATHEDLSVKRTPTGILPIDHILDGGIPRGRFIELYGPYSTMKSYVLYKALGSHQRAGGKVALIDTEHSFDPEWAEQLGCDPDKILVSRPETAEQGIGVMEALVRQRYHLVGFDSIAAAIPKQHQEVAPGEDTQPGALARVMSKGLARLNAANKHTSAIFVNQTREKIGVSFGSPVTTSGGKAMGFYASYRLSFVRIEKVTVPVKKWDGTSWVDKKKTTGHKIQVTLEKSKLSAPHSDTIFTYDLTTGEVDDRGYLIGQGLEAGLLSRTQTGHWTIPGVLDKSIHGRDKFDKYIDANSEIVDWLKEQIMGEAL